ncbi:MAG: hypothetical protein LBT09_10750 [Planctomycetaceae bacterium]|nr:hypothetical protein [Planctomycetaceae bacterium]
MTLVFVAALAFIGSAVYADDAAAVKTEAPIVIGPYSHGFGNHGSPFGGHFTGDYDVPGQKVGILTRIGNRIKSARAAREARKASYGGGFDGGYPAPKRKLFAPRNKAGFGGAHQGYQGYQEFPTEFQVGGYY